MLYSCTHVAMDVRGLTPETVKRTVHNRRASAEQQCRIHWVSC